MAGTRLYDGRTEIYKKALEGKHEGSHIQDGFIMLKLL
jgi:hypothetical protein